MQTCTADELIFARSWIGETADDDDTFNERFDRSYRLDTTLYSDMKARRAGALYQAIEESLRHQLAVMAQDQPSSMSADGNSVSYAGNLKTLQDRLKEFISLYGSQRAKIVKQHRFLRR